MDFDGRLGRLSICKVRSIIFSNGNEPLGIVAVRTEKFSANQKEVHSGYCLPERIIEDFQISQIAISGQTDLTLQMESHLGF